MTTGILWAVVLEDKDGGKNMKRCSTEDEANSESKILITAIEKRKIKGFKVYISQLEYNKDKNDRLVDSKLVDDYSELLFSN